ncbi:MAG TPA: hypothetical protein VF914_10925 [Chloroflexia bacterium]
MEPYTRRRARTRTRATAGNTRKPPTCPRVYYPTHAHLYLGDKTPLYLNWIVEGPDGNLYQVPAEVGGWAHRSDYSGPREPLKPVEVHMGKALIEMLRADGEPFQLTA